MTVANDLVGRAEVLLKALPPAVDGATGAPIPSRLFRTREWADILAFKLGLSVGEPGFAETADELEAIVAKRADSRFRFGVERYERLLPLYRWVDARVRGEAMELPDAARLQRGVMGFDPVTILRHLRGADAERHRASRMPFWAGVKAFADGDSHRAATELTTWLNSPLPGLPAGFEIGAAVRLLNRLRAVPGSPDHGSRPSVGPAG
jgi:hypothetical protein